MLFRIFLVSLFLYVACSPQNNTGNIPYVPINTYLNLNSQNLQALNAVGGVAEVDGIGVRGILVYRESSQTYRVFERNCTFMPNEPCADVHIDPTGLYFSDSCCQSIFDFTGYVISGPAAYGLLEYQNDLSGTLLHIYN